MSVFGPAPRSVLGSVFPAQRFFPRSLFSAGEVGAWYDPSDLTTLFQDTGGTTPVTTAGQRVALMRDKSGRGNHATQSVLAQQPLYAVEPATGRRNLLTYSEQFDNVVWTKNSATISANAAAAPDGSTTADKYIQNTGAAKAWVSQNLTVTSGLSYTHSVYAKAAEFGFLNLTFDGLLFPDTFATFNLTNGVVGDTGNVTASISNVGGGWFRCVATAVCSGSGSATFRHMAAPTNVGWFPTTTGDGTSGVLIWGAQLETGSTATAYQRVVTAQDVSEAGVAPRHYLFFDGIDDGMLTSTITPGVDKVSVFAGINRLGGTNTSIVLETSINSTGNNGAFYLSSPNSAVPASTLFLAKGSAAINFAQTTNYTAATDVFTGIADISGDLVQLRRNGVLVGSDTDDNGAGNFGAYPLYIGRRGNTTSPFNGHLYGAIVRFSAANLAAAQIAAAERWMAGKTGIVI